MVRNNRIALLCRRPEPLTQNDSQPLMGDANSSTASGRCERLADFHKSGVVDIEEEIKARVRAAKAWDKESKLEDFQIKAAENGYVLINLKTRRAQLIYDELSELHDLEQLFPGCFGKEL
jgi:5-methylcytosine-specific restriction endonuclease McrA